MRLPLRRRDPWWDLEGRSVRRDRHLRKVLELLVALSIVALLVLVFRPMNVRAAGGGVNLDQWASRDLAWQNGNLNGNNSRYPEGGVVPFRLAVEGLSKGSHTIHINYDFTAGGHKAYDFLATWSAWRSPNLCGAGGGGVSSMCPGLPASSSRAFPTDPFVANGLSVTAAEVYSAASRRLTIWGGTITSISGPVHGGSVNGNSSADFKVNFTSSGSAVLLAWGGHLAQSAFWDKAAGGPRDGAGTVSGSPWHMRTLSLDGAGNKNQDRSIQPSAIVGELPPFGLAPTPPPTPRPTPPAVPAPTPTLRPGGTNLPGVPAPPAGPTVFLSPPPTSTATDRATAREPLGVLQVLAILAGMSLAVGWQGALTRRRRGAPPS
jgi:hypothetical protein